MKTELHNPEEVGKTSKQLALTYGLTWAGINIVVFLLVYYGLPQIIGSWKHSLIQIVVGLGLAIYFTLEIRKQIGGFWTYKEAISAIFVLFIVPSIVLFFFSLIFGKWVDPNYNNIVKETALNTTTELMERFTDDQELIDTSIAEAEIALEKQLNPSLGDVFKSLAFSVLAYFIIALIWAAIFKRDRPVFMTRPEAEELEE